MTWHRKTPFSRHCVQTYDIVSYDTTLVWSTYQIVCIRQTYCICMFRHTRLYAILFQKLWPLQPSTTSSLNKLPWKGFNHIWTPFQFLHCYSWFWSFSELGTEIMENTRPVYVKTFWLSNEFFCRSTSSSYVSSPCWLGLFRTAR